METGRRKKGSFIGFIPLLSFLVVYFGMGVVTGDFQNLPLMIGMFIATAVSFMITSPVAEKKTFSEKVEIYCRGGGDNTLILMVIIYMLAGAFYGVAGAMKATDTVTNLGISLLPARLILPGLFIIACILSFSMGTSMGTISALMPIAVSISQKTGVNIALVSGVVVGGAMFGDNLSFISDTTIAATTTQGIAMKDKFKANIIMVLPAVIITIIALVFWPIDPNAIDAKGAINLVNLIPYILIIGLALMGMHVIPAMGISIMSGVLIGIIHGDFTFIESFGVVHEGMTWMQDMAVIAILVGGVIAMTKYLGGIDWLLNNLSKNTKSKTGAQLSIAGLVSLVDVTTTNNTMAIIACGPIAKEISDQYDIPPSRTASILDIFSSAFNGVTPYAGQLLVAGGMAKISPVSIMPYVWYSYLMMIFGVLFIVFNIGIRKVKK